MAIFGPWINKTLTNESCEYSQLHWWVTWEELQYCVSFGQITPNARYRTLIRCWWVRVYEYITTWTHFPYYQGNIAELCIFFAVGEITKTSCITNVRILRAYNISHEISSQFWWPLFYHSYVFSSNATFVIDSSLYFESHDDVIKWKHFPCNWPFVRGLHRSPMNSGHKG